MFKTLFSKFSITCTPAPSLFIDSSHTVRIGGDVNYLFLEVLPRLKPGVIVHVHDIFFPFDYRRGRGGGGIFFLGGRNLFLTVPTLYFPPLGVLGPKNPHPPSKEVR